MAKGTPTVPGRPLAIALTLLVVGVTPLAGCGGSSSSTPPSTKAPTTTTTTIPCAAHPSKGTEGKAQVTVNPGTCLKGGETVTIAGSGLASDSPGGLAECNSAAGQPTVTVAGSQVPVSCTDPLAQSVETSGRSLDAEFTVITGITGPPASGTDSAGKPSMRAAVAYPCPPTPAQAAAGATCNINFGDAGGNQVSVPIGFVAHVRPTSLKPGGTLHSSSALGGLSG